MAPPLLALRPHPARACGARGLGFSPANSESRCLGLGSDGRWTDASLFCPPLHSCRAENTRLVCCIGSYDNGADRQRREKNGGEAGLEMTPRWCAFSDTRMAGCPTNWRREPSRQASSICARVDMLATLPHLPWPVGGARNPIPPCSMHGFNGVAGEQESREGPAAHGTRQPQSFAASKVE
ncbi:hypothetical protein GQ53DRAFT_155217 [Thozetella sp. PMI_491]|nr:hypothetical protein GQ53DRAFT_155217 [Thozetella sp. PMI_491]